MFRAILFLGSFGSSSSCLYVLMLFTLKSLSSNAPSDVFGSCSMFDFTWRSLKLDHLSECLWLVFGYILVLAMFSNVLMF